MLDLDVLGRKYDAGRFGGYLSYPLINCWKQSISDADVLDLCHQSGNPDGEGAYLYFHFPYCRTICTYCACFITATAEPERKYDDYIAYLLKEVERKLGTRDG